MGATALHVHVNASGGRGDGGKGVAYIWRGDLLTEGFLHHEFRGLICGGDCLPNFTVVL